MSFVRSVIGPAIRPALRIWLPVAAATTVLAGLGYVVVQQDLRLSANDVPQQLAEDAATRLDAGAAPLDVVPATKTDIRASLAPFVMVYDEQGNLLASSAVLDGAAPQYPTQAFSDARNRHPDTVTWDTLTGARSATVIVPYQHGFVVAGQSLRLTEQLIDKMLLIVVVCWVAALAASAAAALGGVIVLPAR